MMRDNELKKSEIIIACLKLLKVLRQAVFLDSVFRDVRIPDPEWTIWTIRIQNFSCFLKVKNSIQKLNKQLGDPVAYCIHVRFLYDTIYIRNPDQDLETDSFCFIFICARWASCRVDGSLP